MGFVNIPVEKLAACIDNPFTHWNLDAAVTMEMIRQSLMLGTYDRACWSFSHDFSPSDVKAKFNYTEEWHAQRIAYLIVYGWTEPVEIDVGVPSLNYFPYPLIDGHHRLCAAIYRKDGFILASVSGSLNYAFELFGVDCSNYDLEKIEC
jgi:hypothetical protein